MKRVLITGIAGMDGSHMADYLLTKDYQVFGLERHKAKESNENIEHIVDNITLIKGDLTDRSSLIQALEISEPDEVYNFAAQSFVADSWTLAEQTAQITGVGVLNLLQAVKEVNPKIKVQQSSSSEMFGNHKVKQASELTELHPESPYAAAKVFAHHTTRIFRESYNMYAAASICMNHESERRGFHFVTRKVSSTVAKIYLGRESKIALGNLDAGRDWGYAPDYVVGIHKMMQQETPEDFLFATGETHTVREFVEEAFKVIGIEDWKSFVEIDPRFIRPSEVNFLQGDYTKAKTKLNWEPTVMFPELVKRMVENDIKLLRGHYAI